MKSNVVALNKNTELQIILNEIDKIAKYNDLEKKPSLRLRLLAEELIGLIPHFMDYCDGEFWVENKDNEYEIHVSFKAQMPTALEKNQLIAISNSGKNAAYVGVMGKVRGVVEYMLGGYKDRISPEEASEYELGIYEVFTTGSCENPEYSTMWSLDCYCDNVNEDYKNGNKVYEWDELEKSIIANLADDLSIGILGSKVDIIVKKAF